MMSRARSIIFCLGCGPGAHLIWTFAGFILILHSLSELSGWPSTGGLIVNKCTVFVVISSDIGYCDVFVAQYVVRQNRTVDAQPSGHLRIAGFDLASSLGPDRTTHCCVGRGSCAHLTGTFAGAILVLHGLAAPSGWPEAGGLRVKSVSYCVGISGGISSAIGYCDVFVAQ